jgi:hypothetical protein
VATVIACLSRRARQDQAVGDRPAQHHRRADGQRRDPGGVLQIDRDRRGAVVEVDGITQDVAEE